MKQYDAKLGFVFAFFKVKFSILNWVLSYYFFFKNEFLCCRELKKIMFEQTALFAMQKTHLKGL